MSDTTSPPVPKNAPSWLRKKIAGVPVIYIVAGGVLSLAIVAWRMRDTSSLDGELITEEQDYYADDNLQSGYAGPGYTSQPYLPTGTVIAPVPVENAEGNTSITTNDEWLKRGVMFLAGTGVSPGEAQLALSQYLEGHELSFEQGRMRDDTIRELGMPPSPVLVGSTRPDIARVQGPLPRAHTVKNTNENTATKLAMLYYGRKDDFAVAAITSANGGASSYAIGSPVQIPILPAPKPPATPATPAPAKPAPKPKGKPAPKPKARPTRYYTVRKGDTLSHIALRYYGNANKWKPIQTANAIKNPNLILVGQKLIIPYL